MTPKLAEAALKLMVGKWFKFYKEELYITGYEINELNIKLLTDKRTMTINEVDISSILDSFKLLSEPSLPAIPFNNSPVKTINGITELKDILLDNIKKVQSSKEYIPQAQSINDSVKVMIDLAKTEIESIKLGIILKSS